MGRLRARDDSQFTGFTKTEIEKMEKMLEEAEELIIDEQFCCKLAKSFNSVSYRAGKRRVTWTEVQNWFEGRLQDVPKSSQNDSPPPQEPSNQSETSEITQVLYKPGTNMRDISDFKFEAKSSKDKAWYDVETILNHRRLQTGENQILVRFIGFGAEEDEWVNVTNAIRERSVPFESTECDKVKVDDHLLCYQERKDNATYFDCRVMKIERKMHDIRGCRCLFLIRYDHDNIEESVRLKRLCHTPTY